MSPTKHNVLVMHYFAMFSDFMTMVFSDGLTKLNQVKANHSPTTEPKMI